MAEINKVKWVKEERFILEKVSQARFLLGIKPIGPMYID